MAMRPLSPTLADIAHLELNETPDRIQQDFIILREWIKKQRHLRARTSDQFLIAFLRRCKYSLEETKKRIDAFFSFYNIFPEVYKNRCVNSRILAINRLGVHYYPEYPKCSNKAAILMARFGQIDHKHYSVKEIFQFIMMAMEIISLESDYASVAGVCQIIDMKGISFDLIKQYDHCLFQKYWLWIENCCPLRIKEIYIVNADKDIQFRFNLIKSFYKSQMEYPVIILKSFDELYKYIPKCNLPEEYGGTNGHITECVAYMEDLLQSYRNYFNEDTLYGCSEELRSGEVVTYEAGFGLNGSFRKLSIDE